MADNVSVTAGSGTTIATDDVGGAQYQRVKIDVGGDGVASPLVRGQQTKANSLPVTLASDEDTLGVNADGNIGQQTKAASLPVTLASDEDTVQVNADGSIGQQAKAASLPVTLASDEDAIAVIGGAAHDAAASGVPVPIGGVYKSMASGDDVDDDDFAELLLDPTGALVIGRHGNAFTTNDNYSAAQTNDAIQAAPGTGLALQVKTLTFSSDGTAAGSVKLVEDTAGTPVDIAGPYYFPATAGIINIIFDPPLKVTTNKDLGVTSTGITNLTATTTGYTAP